MSAIGSKNESTQRYTGNKNSRIVSVEKLNEEENDKNKKVIIE